MSIEKPAKKKYLVTTREVWCYFYEVEATSRSQAKRLVEDGKATSDNGEFSHRMDSKYWDVEEIKDEG